MRLIKIIFLLPLFLSANSNDIISFESKDSLLISAKPYIVSSQPIPFIILFHQAGWSHGEYQEIAPRLNELGYNCLAVDLRSGGQVNGIINKTNKIATEQKISTTYLDAYVDMQSALSYVINIYSPKKLIVWGSSYSASLVLKLASENSKKINGAIAFSPGEYFAKLGKSKKFITESVSELKCPVFITSAKNEHKNWINIYESVASKNKTFFLPKTEGNHGSRALWEKYEDNVSYWNALQNFLDTFFPIHNSG